MNGSHPIRDEDRRLVAQALRQPRGFYNARRASQLSGVPQGTVNRWARSKLFRPDWSPASPRGWSYRDLLYLRLMAWLRNKGMDPSGAAERVRLVRGVLATDSVDAGIRSDGQHAFLNDESFDRFSGQQAFDGMTLFLDIFDIAQPVDRVSRSAMWGPGLVYPSTHTHISPWVLAGEPCVTRSRISTSALFALRDERRLSTEKILLLYPQIGAEAIDDAINLEKRLRFAGPRTDATAA